MEQSETQHDKLELERVRVLYSNARYLIAGLFTGAFFLALFLWQTTDIRIWLIWLSAILLINLPHLLLVEIFHNRLRKQEVDEANIHHWERWFYIAVIFSSLSWGAVSLFPFEQSTLLSLVYTALILMTLGMASIVTLITSLKMGLTFLSASMFPLIARSMLVGEVAYWILALACLTYYVIFTQIACRLHYAILDNIHLKFENEELSLKDALTGLWNRRQLSLFVDKLHSRAERKGEIFSVILMDLDYFKQYNDSKGHNAGDQLLVDAAAIIMEESRDEDLAVRYGGEEFLVVLPDAGVKEALQVAERIRKGVRERTGVSLSAGVASYLQAESFEKMMGEADKALYRAKSLGRDQVIPYSKSA